MSTQGAKAALRAALGDVSRGFFDITHNGLALLGTLLAVGLITLAARSDLRTSAEQQLLGWLLERQQMTAEALDVAAFNPEPSAIERVTAAQPTDLPKQQANVAFWLSRKYRVAPEPLSVLVAEAFDVGQKARVDPTLILAVMAIESRFNPFAQSPVGAQGLMQVLTRVHTDKYEDFGGRLAAFDPVSNLRVGAKVLQDCIKQAGSIEGGLRLYVGAVSSDGSDYINKVMAEHLRIQSVALGKPMPRYFPQIQRTQVIAPATVEPTPEPDSATDFEAEAPAAPVVPPETPLANS
ncbi:MAG: lytic transglycosylase [Burkholderiales bacterium RIFCSPLOWO2_12_67_14]|nr:MAG: lytic transglycosylase [Burkholderiales bacterium RIFCSPLOWO2_02_FULL_67_64]OGB42843.1 MAG: lytic transglycosylase [Burkholderiales bacterium RIFCSPLOWO2_12_67_14]OGB49946.1 MAG: lytic transglycosylase [Burkholderiales bacterium RIFCSPHIGHO2_12_FULL_67_38]